MNINLLFSQGNMDQFSMLLDHDADPSMGLEKTGRNLLHMLATRCIVNDLRTYMKIILKKVWLPDQAMQTEGTHLFETCYLHSLPASHTSIVLRATVTASLVCSFSSSANAVKPREVHTAQDKL